jgi:hypothetical protein
VCPWEFKQPVLSWFSPQKALARGRLVDHFVYTFFGVESFELPTSTVNHCVCPSYLQHLTDLNTSPIFRRRLLRVSALRHDFGHFALFEANSPVLVVLTGLARSV